MYSLIQPDMDARPTWPKANPTYVLPRGLSKSSVKGKTGAYLKQFGSRPEGRSDQDRRRARGGRG